MSCILSQVIMLLEYIERKLREKTKKLGLKTRDIARNNPRSRESEAKFNRVWIKRVRKRTRGIGFSQAQPIGFLKLLFHPCV